MFDKYQPVELSAAEDPDSVKSRGKADPRLQATDEVLGVAMALAGHGEAARAVRLAAAAHAEQEAIGKTGDHWWSSMQASLLGAARAALPVDEVEAAERTGRDTPFDEILDELLG